MTPNRWEPYEWQRVQKLLERGHSIASIALIIGRKDYQVRDKIRWEQMSTEKREERAARLSARRKSNYIPSATPHGTFSTSASKPAPELFAERDRRLATPRTIGAELMGDPPPGYSALDRKRQGVSA